MQWLATTHWWSFCIQYLGLAVQIDRRLDKKCCNIGELRTKIFDGQLRSFTQNNDNETFALNFLAPLLIECDFPYTADDIERMNILIELTPVEIEYIGRCASRPRSLKLICRDTLRQTFRGRHIHMYLDIVTIPKSVKDFILLNDVLLMLQN